MKLDDLTTFFTTLHIPWPHFNAVLVAYTEFVGGILLLAGPLIADISVEYTVWFWLTLLLTLTFIPLVVVELALA